MAVSDAPRLSSAESQLVLVLRQLQDQAILVAIPLLYVAGTAIITFVARLGPPPRGMLLAVSFWLLAPAVWLVRRWSRRLAGLLLVVACLALDLLVVTWAQAAAALHLLTVPAGLAVLTMGVTWGTATAVAYTVVLACGLVGLVHMDAATRIVSIVGVWTVVGLTQLTLRPLLTALEWSWSSYEESRSLLERARDQQVLLKQTLADLADANTQLTRLNRLANGLRQAAEEAHRIKQQFVANVSHELRTPLNMIIGYSEMILQAPRAYGGMVPPALLADLAVILRNSQHLSNLIDDVLDLSQVEAGQMALTREWTSLSEIVDAAMVAVRPLFESKGLYLASDVPSESTVYCDRTRIREVFLNLLSNAGRFTERGGVRIHASRSGDELVVCVSDTGPGIAPEDKDRLFRPFEQLDGSIRRRHVGTGLGLCISKSFVELHGGKMWLESNEGKGTSVFFRLPTEPPIPVESEVSRWFSPHWQYEERGRVSRAPVPSVRPRFVVVESGGVLGRLISRYLDGVEITATADLDCASGELARAPAQALLVNAASTSEALQKLRGSKVLPPGMPALICSLPGSSEAANALGAADYLLKPISPESLLAALDRLELLSSSTVLMVDDEPEALQLFRRVLASAGRGYRVLMAGNGRQALDILRTERPDVILLDLIMPEVDGFRLLEVRNQDPNLREIPVIITSARDPAGQPIVTDALTVTREGGLSVAQLLTCIEGLSRLFGLRGQSADPGRTAGQRA